jgi:outer membrane protein assembly factor BamB
VVSRDWLIQVENVVVAMNVVYAVINQVGPKPTGVLVALNAQDGALRWCVPLVSKASSIDPQRWHVFAADEQTVYVAEAGSETLLALNTSDGSMRWYTAYGENYYTLVVGQGVIYVMLEQRDGTLTVVAERASDGEQVWRFQPQHWIGGGLVLEGGVLYVAESGPNGSPGYLDEIDARNGTPLAQARLAIGTGGTSLDVGAVADGMIYTAVSTVQENPWGLMAFAANGEKKVWELHQNFVAGPAVADGTVYLCSMENSQSAVSALKATTGEPLWNQALPDQAPAAQMKPAITFSQYFTDPLVLNGLVYVGYYAAEGDTLAPVLAALDGKTGAIQWRLANEIPMAVA